MIVVKIMFQEDMIVNGLRIGVSDFTATRSRKWEIHPTSTDMSGYNTDTVVRAFVFTDALSLIAASRLLCETSSFLCKTFIINLSSLSPFTEFSIN